MTVVDATQIEVQVGACYRPLFYPKELQPTVILFDGNRGSGKTRAILTALMTRALEWPGSTWALWRSRRTRLTETVLKTFERQVLPAFGMSVPHIQNRARYTLPNGSVFVPIGLDDKLRNTSAEFAGGYLNEGVELDSLDDAQALLGSLREDTVPFHQLIIDTNPDYPGHWLNQKAETVSKSLRRLPENRAQYDRLQAHNWKPATDPKVRWKRIICGHEDNPGYFDLDRWQFTDLGREYIEETLSGLSGSLKRRWMNREWAASVGSVYPDFDEELHCMDAFAIPDDWPIFFGYDAGFDHPTAILWFTVAPTGKMYVIHEHFYSGYMVPWHAQKVKELEQEMHWGPRQRYADPQHVFSVKAEGCLADQWRTQGFNLTPWPPTGRHEEAMVEAVRKRFDDGSLKIFRNCVNTIFQHQAWRYKRNAAGEMLAGEDTFEDKNNDTCDVLKGVVAANPQFGAGGVTVLNSARR